MLFELPGSLQPAPERVKLPPDAAKAGTGAAIAIAGTAQAMAFVTVRRLMPPVGCSSFSLIVDPPQSQPAIPVRRPEVLCSLCGERVVRCEDVSPMTPALGTPARPVG